MDTRTISHNSIGGNASIIFGNITISENIRLQKEILRDAETTEILRDLFVVDPQDDMEKIEKNKDTLLDGAYKWVLDTKEFAAFTRWSDDQSNPETCQALWIKGHAGTGKTMLLIGIIRKLSSQPAEAAPSVSHFFCQGTDAALNSATATLRSLIWMLLIQQPHLISHLQSKHKFAGSSLFRGDRAFTALSKAFESMLKDPGLSRAYFVIDALDECEQDLADLIKLISTSLTLSKKVKWLVSSRPTVIGLRTPGTVHALVELDAQRLDDPVNAYINYKLSILKTRDGYDDNLLVKVAEEVRSRAQNTFLWVALAFKELDREDMDLNPVHGVYALDIIRRMPLGLSELYHHMMTRIEKRMEKDPQYCKNVLVAAALAYRPLTLSELAVLAGLPREMHPRTIVSKCGSFLTTKEETVSLIHQSAKDYLEENYTIRLHSAGAAQGHADISRRSIDAMLTLTRENGELVLKRNIYGSGNFGFRPKSTELPNPDPLTPLRYSCVFWADHLLKGENRECEKALADDGAVFEFLKERFLRWLESLSLLGKLSDGILTIRKLLQIVQQSGTSPRLAGFLEDAEKFVRSHGSILERAPLQIYSSPLVFSPAMSEVKRAQWKERLSVIKVVAGIRDHWDAYRQTLEGHSDWVSAIAFSPDSKMLASASRDRTVRLWDTVTGAHRQTLEGHGDWVTAIAFSPDGKTLASASYDSTVRLWDTATGAHRQTLEGHSDWVNAINFSPDGKTLASASGDRTGRLWDITTGAHRQTLEGYSDWVSAVAFSPDSKILASASYNHTVRLWDIVTGVHRQTLKGHSGWVNAINFSLDGKTLASASGDHTARLWDIATGTHRQTLEGHSGSVITIAFSPDGKTLASASYDHTARLWDTATGAYQQTLKGHSGPVTAIAFSPDGKALVSASHDRTVRLWDTATGAHRQTLEGHSGPVTTIAFSLDGKILASASHDRTVRLWDTATGVYRQTLEGHSGPVNTIAFSPDGKILVSASRDYTVRLWDTAIGAHRQILKRDSGPVTAIAFSPDSKTLASASRDRIVRLWDTATGIHRQILKGHSDLINTIAFSLDGKILASASHDRTVRLWDTATGVYRQTLEGHSGPVTAIAFSPDNKTLASASYDRTVRLWDIATGAYQQILEGHDDWVTAIAFSPDSKTLASASYDSTVRLWDAATGAQRQTLEGHSDWVNAIAFSPDSKTLASASYDHTVRLWDTATGAHHQTLKTNQTLRNLIFLEDSQHLKTDRGLLSLSPTSTSPNKQSLDHTLYIDEEWITLDGKNLLWLPKDYRPTSAALYKNTAVLGHRSGGLTFLQFEFS